MDRKMQTVLITGGSSGIGRIAALEIAELGYRVYTAARRLDKMEDLRKSGIHPLKIDLTDSQSIRQGMEKILSQSGGVDILINNAGYGSYGSVEEVPMEEARRQFDVNLFGLAEITRTVLPGMRERGRGRIINVSSIAGRIHAPYAAWYHASKHALEGFNSCLRTEVSPFGIEVISVQPGPIRTEWLDISAENLLKQSGRGPYADEVGKVASSYRRLFAQPFTSAAPEKIAGVIVKAATASRPPTRYVCPAGAKMMLLLRWGLPDRILDFLTRKAVGL